MPIAAQVKEQIAAIREKYGADWHRSGEALAEASACWGGGANRHGVFVTGEREEIANLSPTCLAAITLAQSGNGLWSYGLDYQAGYSGMGVLPGIWREPFDTRQEARRAALSFLAERIEQITPKNRQTTELLRKVKSANAQRTLFD